jgi:hypothetical protein
MDKIMKALCLIFLFSLNAWSFDHEHSLFKVVLKKNLSRRGQQTFVDYQKLKKDPEELDKYLSDLKGVTKGQYKAWTQEEKLAALINGYNAWTLKLIIEHYPVSSIKKIGSIFRSPWEKKFITWLGEEVSLDHIEHEVIRKDFSEPRIHFALVCAAMGCPPLQEEPYRASALSVQLEKASSNFLTDRDENRYTIKDHVIELKVSNIFKWYGKDFGTEKDLIKFLVNEMGINDQIKNKKIEISYLNYDWSLNDVR